MEIRKILFGTMLAFAAIGARPLQAADLPARSYKAPPMMAPVAASWSGCTLGVVGGGVWGSSRHVAVNSPNPLDAGLPITNSFGLSGGAIGGTTGCNIQFDSWVFGIENDISWTNARGSAPDVPPFSRFAVSQTNEKWLDTLRGRVGFAWDRALLYGTGGAAFAGTSATICSTVATGLCASNSQTRTGWVAGAGIEYAMWENVSLKFEYLHADFGNGRYFSTPLVFGPVNIVTRDVRLTDDIVRAGVNWRFTSLPGMLSAGQ
jgi:outer membrane immunogenic protein